MARTRDPKVQTPKVQTQTSSIAMTDHPTPPVDEAALATARLAAIVDSSFDAIVSKNLASIITTWNAGAERLFGYSADEIIGRSVLVLIPPQLRNEEDRIIERVRMGERVETFDTVRLRKDGSLVDVSLTVSPIKDAEGRIIGASKIARDISASKESERRIHLLMREVNHRVKNQFAVILSMVRESAKSARSTDAFTRDIADRILALSRSHDLLVEAQWRGTGLFNLVEQHLRPFSQDHKVSLSGPLVKLSVSAVQHLGMALHELATNSLKYGALSQEAGEIDVSWTIGENAVDDRFELIWRETFGSKPPDDSGTTGFGTTVLAVVTPRSLMGTSELQRDARGLRWALRAPLSVVTQNAPPVIG
jgi:PAS domain S-box-containing protein